MPDETEKRVGFIVRGQVQGVGFRPFVWRLANSRGLTGSVQNTSAGVLIEAQGLSGALAHFERDLLNKLPPLAKITDIKKHGLPLARDEDSFSIRQSLGHGGQSVLISPDVGICQDCLADMRQPGNRRFHYAFTNCTNCGPRYTITRRIPYDRPTTSMACFSLCRRCEAEYSDPGDRRFHAQPIACHECGPRLWFVNADAAREGATFPSAANMREALENAGRLLMSGNILALKGLGGFQLACDAKNTAAIQELRARKSRPRKALAVMARSIENIRAFCRLEPLHEKLLTGPEKPVVLCPKRFVSPACLSEAIAPDNGQIGVMLPYTPLHALLFDWLHDNGMPDPVLVMTSANPADEPICLGNREALLRLAGIADGWLLHDRDILVRVDDSVVDAGGFDISGNIPSTAPQFVRRARGYAPAPVTIDSGETACVLGAGGELKSTFCLTRDNHAFVSQHIGDLKNPETLAFYAQTFEHLCGILETEPAAIVRDLHPDFISSRFAIEYGLKNNIPVWTLQHHAAHAACALAENNCYGPALALCLDGSGLGPDGSIWGGEIIFMDLSKPYWRRAGSLAPFRLPGGDAAVRHPWRIAQALTRDAGIACDFPQIPALEKQAVAEMLERGLNCPPTSSLGRFFDAFAALLGICNNITYEGQAAVRLEETARGWFASNCGKHPPELCDNDYIESDGLLLMDSQAMFRAGAAALKKGLEPQAIAAGFHFMTARCYAAMCHELAQKFHIRQIALSGGVMQNRIMRCLLQSFLRDFGLEPLLHRNLPPGDGGISLGQAVWGRKILASGNPASGLSASV